MHKRRWSVPDLKRLVQQLGAYKAGTAPFDMPHGGGGFSVRAWWQAVSSSNADMLVPLALLLLDVVPHAAAPERAFSLLKWFSSERRNRMSVSTACALAATKMHYQQQMSAQPARRDDNATSSTQQQAHHAQSDSAPDDDVSNTGVDELQIDEECDELDGDELDAVLTKCFNEDLQSRPAPADSAALSALSPATLLTWDGINMTSPVLARGNSSLASVQHKQGSMSVNEAVDSSYNFDKIWQAGS